MITEDFVSFETAKLLKEKGFDCSSYNHYKLDNGELCCFNTNCSTNVKQNNYITAPTLQMAMKWLREKHSCFITFFWEFDKYDDNGKPIFGKTNWQYNISIPKWNSARIGDGSYFDMYSEEEFPTYEETLEAAIKYCLENLV